MTKKNFIALADAIRKHQNHADPDTCMTGWTTLTSDQIEMLADFCAAQNAQFNRERWLGYIAGSNGNNGGVRKAKREYQPKTGQPCSCRPGMQRDNCPQCEGTGQRIDFAAIRGAR